MKQYQNPFVEIISLNEADVLRTSLQGDGAQGMPEAWEDLILS